MKRWIGLIVIAMSGILMTAQAQQIGYLVPATLETFVQDGTDIPSNNTEIMHLTTHRGRLYAATGQWMAEQIDGAQVLVKETADAPWRVFERFAVVRVDAMESFTIPADLNNGTPVEVLITQARRGTSQAAAEEAQQIMWLRDDETSFGNEFSLGTPNASVRSFGGQVEDNVFAFYAGVTPFGIIRGEWDADAQTIVNWERRIELERPGERNKFTGFASCGSAMYASVNNELYRRNPTAQPDGSPLWVSVGQAPQALGSGLRGLTCIDHEGQPALLVALEGPGTIVRIGPLPQGNLNEDVQLPVAIEVEPRDLIREALSAGGIEVPDSGHGAIAYVIPAYNEFLELSRGGRTVHAFGVEWAYAEANACPEGRTCLPERDFDTAACFFVRVNATRYSTHCLEGSDFAVSASPQEPVQYREAFVAVRTIRQSPFAPETIYFGGYDANSVRSNETAWIATVNLRDLQ